jgi:uncharacterized protein (TIGR02246 family)
MNTGGLLRLAGTNLLFVAVCFPQAKPAWIQDRFENLDFVSGSPGEMPPGWHLGQMGTSGYSAAIVAGSCNHSGQCGCVRSVGAGPHNGSFLYQNVDATAYRGKWLAYRAAVRADLIGETVARLLVRIHRGDGSTSFRDDMGVHPITSGPWKFYEIDAPIDAAARDIEFGMQLLGEGSATIDNISFAFGDTREQVVEDGRVRALIDRFSDLRNAHDGAGLAALYSEDGEWLSSSGEQVIHGRQALTTLWNRVPGRVDRWVDSVELVGASIAVVRVTDEYTEPIGRHHDSFVAVKENGTWFIRIHQQVD